MGIPLTLGKVRQRVDKSIICQCSEIIMKSDGGTDKIRAKILLIKGGDVFAVCKKCGDEVQVPLQKSGPPLILRK